jgi:hypothetical protein
MSKAELENLVVIGRLKREPSARNEYSGMLSAARVRLKDARNEGLDPDSRFDLAYGAAHRLAMAALRREGYRSQNRITVFHACTHACNQRNRRADLSQGSQRAEPCRVPGPLGHRAKLRADLIRCTNALDAAIAKLDPPAGD